MIIRRLMRPETCAIPGKNVDKAHDSRTRFAKAKHKIPRVMNREIYDTRISWIDVRERPDLTQGYMRVLLRGTRSTDLREKLSGLPSRSQSDPEVEAVGDNVHADFSSRAT